MAQSGRGIVPRSRAGASLLATVFLTFLTSASSAAAQSLAQVEGMWSDPPATPLGEFCSGWCTDAGIERLNALLDDPANDTRSFQQLQADASRYQLDAYIVPRLTAAARRAYPLDPAEDPAFLRCEPYGLARQMRSRHQLEVRRSGVDRLELRYGEWDARRTVYLDGREQPADWSPTLLGHSVGRWDGDALVIETTGISANRFPFPVAHSDRLRIVERYTRSMDGNSRTLILDATLEDPETLREPVVVKRIWRWAPEIQIEPYVDCERPAEYRRATP